MVLRRVLQLSALRFRSNDLKELEIVALRHELAILQRTRRPAMTWTDRLFLTRPADFCRVHAGGLSSSHRRRCFAGIDAWWGSVGPTRVELGARRFAVRSESLFVRLARDNPRWGYQRIVGELKSLRIVVSATTVRTWLRAAGLDQQARAVG